MGLLRSLCAPLGLAVLLGLGGCASVLTEGAKKTLENRQTSDFVTDTQISTSLMSALAHKDAGLAMDVNIDVWEQRVMLTGTVTDSRLRAEVVQKAREDKRVQKVYDEIQVVSPQEQERRKAASAKGDASKKEGMERVVSDYWIETKISAQLMAAKDVSSVNLRWRSVRNTVYLIGRCQTAQEQRKAIEVIRGIDGVQALKSFVEVKRY